MHRSHGNRSSHESAGCARAYSACAAILCRASAVNGSLPSGGSTISDVRRFEAILPRSHQIALYVPGSPGGGGASTWVSASSFAASSRVKNSRLPTEEGRSRGVKLAYDQTPCRSGSPHGVSGAVSVFDLAFVFGGEEGAWAETRAIASAAQKMSTAGTDGCLIRSFRSDFRISGSLSLSWLPSN